MSHISASLLISHALISKIGQQVNCREIYVQEIEKKNIALKILWTSIRLILPNADFKFECCISFVELCWAQTLLRITLWWPQKGLNCKPLTYFYLFICWYYLQSIHSKIVKNNLSKSTPPFTKLKITNLAMLYNTFTRTTHIITKVK